jgi:hypothetical protein
MERSNLPPPYGSAVGAAGFKIPVLPQSVSIGQVYTDFIKYIMKNVQLSFEQGIPNGAIIWRRLRDTLVLVLTTPNGWDLAQQGVLRYAVTHSGVIKAEKMHELLEFVTEGEASVHYALTYSQSKTWLATGSIFAMVDAGGSTVDSTLYECKSTNPRVMLEEVCPSECIQVRTLPTSNGHHLSGLIYLNVTGRWNLYRRCSRSHTQAETAGHPVWGGRLYCRHGGGV